ncbi:MAG: SUMF1/EgtB/PvdO family nonheme iron enzyme [Planctomycetota bacterium]|nr:SUMF1/EgtB/PvdO family nonheme iron enzyme [Planctomycetota bacterium]
MMPAPQRTQYNEAIQNLRQCVSDEELRSGELAVNAFGLPLVWAGGFADVYRVHCPQSGNTWAVKCFVKETPRLRERYREISSYLQQARLPFTVDFQVVQPGLRVGDQWAPILKMRWVEGLSLNQFVSKHLERPKNLRQLLELWPRLATRLQEAGMAHGDLQHGNVLLVPVPETGRLSLKLVDYDGMFVPALAGYRTGEVGHPAYQHPQRLREAIYNAQIDRFSHLAIYTAIQGVIVGGGDLWRRNDNGDNLLFREVDYQNPGLSATLQQLWDLGDAELQSLTGHLILAAEGQLEQVPLLDEIIIGGQVQRLAAKEQQRVERLLFPSRGARPAHRPPVLVEPAEPVPAKVSPQPPAPVGPVVVTCVCGQSFAAAPHLYGKQVPCPVCRAPIDVPRPGVTDSAADPLADLTPTDDPWTAELPSPAMVSPAPLPRIPRPVPKAEPIAEVGEFLRRNWIPTSAVSLGVLAILVLLVMIFSPFRGGPQPPTETARSSALPPVDVSQQESDATTAEGTPPPLSQDNAIAAGKPAPTSETLTNSIGMKLVLIPAGEFMMGSPESPEQLTKAFPAYVDKYDYFKGEQPPHRVRITKAFYLGIHEVTMGQFRQFVETANYRTEAERDGRGGRGYNESTGHESGKQYTWRNTGWNQTDNHPVVNVTWGDAVAFCDWLSRKEGGTYRLPTEAEWEYACRANTATRWYHGDDPEGLAQVANVPDATAKAKRWPGSSIRASDGYAFTAPVGSFQPNTFGLYDMQGNVWEWCADWYDENYYSTSPSDDPTGPSTGVVRVNRNGSFGNSPLSSRSAARSGIAPSYRSSSSGFRVAMTLPDATPAANP